MGFISRINPILEALNASTCRVYKLFIQKDVFSEKITKITAAAEKRKIPCLFVSKRKMDALAEHHQGAVAFVTGKTTIPMENIMSSSPCPFILLLDGIEDPQNLGAIIRTAEGAGVDGIILPERRAAGLTETVSRVSAGALEYMRIARVKNLAQAMEQLRRQNVWLVGAEGGGQRKWFEFDFTVPVAIVLGSEGRGLRPLIRSKCDELLSLPHSGRLTSLNVAAAAAVFLYEVVRQREGG